MGNESQNPQNPFSILCWNIANPSVDRAAKQASWLRNRPESVFVLTEAKRSEGCLLLERYFRVFLGYSCLSTKPENNEYGVIVISKDPLKTSLLLNSLTYLKSRGISVTVTFSENELEIIGIYVPSRDSSPEKRDRKKLFLESISNVLRANPVSNRRILCGDLNVLEPDHTPHYPFFEDWEYTFYKDLSKFQLIDAFRYYSPQTKEYSWIGRTGEGYRYDHCFVSLDLLPLVQKCYYLHEPRIKRLSDHSALVTELLV